MPPHHRRLAQLRAQLRDRHAVQRSLPPIPSAASAAAEIVEGLPPKLLTDLQMRQFVSDGWLALPVTEMPDLHAELHASAQKMWEMNGEENGGSVGNNVYPAIPQLKTVFDGPTVRHGEAGELRRFQVENRGTRGPFKEADAGGDHPPLA